MTNIKFEYQTAGIFEMRVKNAEGKEETWTIDLKTTGTVYRGPSKTKPNVTIMLSDETLTDLGDGKVYHLRRLLVSARG